MKGELILHYYWKYRSYPKTYLHSSGKPLTILRPGDYNLSWGPDFTDAVIEFEGKTQAGDIEIHTDQSDWEKHSHQINPRYNRVCLHVFLKKSENSNRNFFKEKVLELKLNEKEVSRFSATSKSGQVLSRIPGACGLAINKDNLTLLKKTLYQAAEERISLKKTDILNSIREGSESEEILFQKIFRSIGYGGHQDYFEEMARNYPYQPLKTKLFQSSTREVSTQILALWAKALGLSYETKKSRGDEETNRFLFRVSEEAKNLGANSSKKYKTPEPSRPHNSAWNRLFGMYFHLYNCKSEGLLQTWLRIIKDNSSDSPVNESLLNELNEKFQCPADQRFPEAFKKSVLGRQRLLAMLVNAIIPFFMAYAEIIKEPELEEIMTRIFLNLPSEESNRKTRFMEEKLGLNRLGKGEIRKNPAYSQGLIQIHDESCKNFNEDCKGCGFLNLFK